MSNSTMSVTCLHQRSRFSLLLLILSMKTAPITSKPALPTLPTSATLQLLPPLPTLPVEEYPTLPILPTLLTERDSSPSTSAKRSLPIPTTVSQTTTTSLPNILSRTEVVDLSKVISLLRTLDKDRNNYLTIGEMKTGLSAYFAQIVMSVEEVVAKAGEDKGRVALADLDKLADELAQGKQEGEGEEGRLYYRIVDHVPSNCATGLVDEQGNCRSPWG